jgi:ArsR family transcriptional regulator, lead/cadmium/zinc/bismuth-responsive transcriptional repressor
LDSDVQDQPDTITDCYTLEATDCGPADAATLAKVRAGMVSQPVARDLAAIFKALADPTRVRIISALAGREFCVNDLAAGLEMGQSAVSHQLSDLRAMGLVTARRAGRHVFYRLADDHVEQLFAVGLEHVQESQDMRQDVGQDVGQ